MKRIFAKLLDRWRYRHFRRDAGRQFFMIQGTRKVRLTISSKIGGETCFVVLPSAD